MTDDIEEILAHLNKLSGANFRAKTPAGQPTENAIMIKHRLKDGYTLQNMLDVVSLQAREWGGDPVMSKYLRPKTLFCKTNFDTYIAKVTPNTTDSDIRREVDTIPENTRKGERPTGSGSTSQRDASKLEASTRSKERFQPKWMKTAIADHPEWAKRDHETSKEYAMRMRAIAKEQIKRFRERQPK